MAICDNMRAIRLKKGLTQKQVAEACGLADSTIRTYELGNANPKPATVAKLAKALGVTAAELYGVDWMPGIADTPDQETSSALYQSVLDGPLPIDNPIKARLIVAFDKLNTEGQLELIKRSEELTQIPAYQAAQAGFSSDEIERLRRLCQKIQNQQSQSSMMAKSKRKNESAESSSHSPIDRAINEIVNIILKHFLSPDPEQSAKEETSIRNDVFLRVLKEYVAKSCDAVDIISINNQSPDAVPAHVPCTDVIMKYCESGTTYIRHFICLPKSDNPEDFSAEDVFSWASDQGYQDKYLLSIVLTSEDEYNRLCARYDRWRDDDDRKLNMDGLASNPPFYSMLYFDQKAEAIQEQKLWEDDCSIDGL